MRRAIALAAITVLSLPGCSSDPLSAGVDASTMDFGAMATDFGATAADGAVADAARDAAPTGLPGQPCAQPSDCQSASSPFANLHPTPCIPAPSWPGGYCVHFCTLPAEPFVLPRLARADCPAGSVCLPRWFESQQIERAEIGACLAECQVDSDCRAAEGYFCRHEFWTGTPPAKVSFANGYCAPMHCTTRGCFTSFNCGC